MNTKPYGIAKKNLPTKGYMRDMFHQYRGAVAALDEGIMGSDAVLAAAVWRNLFGAGWGTVGGVERRIRTKKGNKEPEPVVDPESPEEATLRDAEFARSLERIVVWMRSEIARLEAVPDEAVRLAAEETIAFGRL
jgi:cytochrome b pre-mRNA-processing protein 3